MIIFVVILFLSHTSDAVENSVFGYISYTTNNIGDDIQAIAAKQFLPEDAIPIDRQYIAAFRNDTKVKAIVNGWFTNLSLYIRNPNLPIPERFWPPTADVDPFFISFHLTKSFLHIALSDEGVDYLRTHAPIGARDLYTLEVLQAKGISAYFSGCLTLTLENQYQSRDDIIYVVDLDERCYQYVVDHSMSRVVRLSHKVNPQNYATNEDRLKHAESLLEKYRKAKCVITSRLHATMPCIAFQTPVLLVESGADYRFRGLRELTHRCKESELTSGEVDFDFNNPPENPQNYLIIRENLIKMIENRIKNW